MHAQSGNIIEFGEFRLDTEKKILWIGTEIVALPKKAIELLCVLVENRGEVMSKDALMDTVWADSFVEESVLTQNIYLLRKTIKESGNGASIKNVPRRGYMFSGEVRQPESGGTDLVIERHTYEKIEIEEIETTPDEPLLLPAKPAVPGLWVAAAALLIAVLAGGFFLWKSRNTETIRTLAVLPLKQLGNTVGDDSLNMRITDSLITRLGNLKEISVRPTSSIVRFANGETDPLQAGKMLEVDAVLDGRIQREGENLRINLQMISVATGDQVWSGQFDGNSNALLSLQDLIASELIEKVNFPDSGRQAAGSAMKPTDNAEAYEKYLRGRYHWNTRTEEGFERAIEYFEQAVTLDPEFAEAFSGLADSYVGLYDYGIKQADDCIPKAKSAIGRALQLNPNSAEAHSTLSAIQFLYDRLPAEAETSIRRSIELNPRYATAHLRYGWYLSVMGRFDEAANELEIARQQDPTSAIVQTNIGYLYASSGRHELAEQQFYKVISTNPKFSLPYWYLGGLYFFQNKRPEMFEKYLTAFELDSGSDASADIRQAWNTKGEAAALELWSSKLEAAYGKAYFPPTNIALIAALRQDREKTLKWLAESEVKNDPWLLQVKYDHEYDFIRDDPRFQAILNKMNLR